MSVERDFPVERALESFSKLGKALESYQSTIVSYSEHLQGANKEIQGAAKRSKPSKKPYDPIAETFQKEHAKLSQLEMECGQLSVVMGDIGASSAYASMAKLKKQMLDVNEAMERGIIDLHTAQKETARLRKELHKAELRTMGHGSVEGLSSSSRWGASAHGALAELSGVTMSAGKGLISQIAGIGTGVMGLASGVLPVAGGLGLFALMLWGVKEGDRLRAQAGEAVNLAIAAGGGAHDRGVAWMSAFQEKAQKFYGISRSEVQGVFKNFMKAGIATAEMFATYDKSLGEVGTNAISATLAADRYFEMAQGATSRTASQLVSQFGVGLHRAVELTIGVEFAARRAGFGTGGFVSWAAEAAMQVRTLGVKMEDVASAAFTMRSRYQQAGVDSVSLAKQSTTEMLSGLAGMGTGREVWAAEKLGFGGGLVGREALKEGLLRHDPGILSKLASLWRKEALVAGGGDEYAARHFLEVQGMGHEGARAIMDLGDTSDGSKKVHELKKEDRKALTTAFKDEATKTSELKRKTNDLLAALAKTGQAALALLANFLGAVVVAVKGLPVWFMGTADERKMVKAKYDEVMSGIGDSWKDLMASGGDVYRSITNITGPFLQPLTEAWNFQPIVHLTEKEREAFTIKDPEQRANAIRSIAAKYGLSRETFEIQKKRTEYVSLQMEPVRYPNPSKPRMPAVPAAKDPTKELPPPPSTEVQPGDRAPPLKLNLGGKEIVVGSTGPDIRVKTNWLAPPNAENLVAHVVLEVVT